MASGKNTGYCRGKQEGKKGKGDVVQDSFLRLNSM
jgi:hypothetical protein